MRVRPLVIYSGNAEEPVGVVYVPTNDGYLHAIDSQTGIELWSFIPPEFLPRLKRLYEDAVTPEREYAIDGDVTVFKYDINGNGIVDGSDKVYIIFGFGRGGSAYYALDVTNKTSPSLLWKRDATHFPGLGKAWSTPDHRQDRDRRRDPERWQVRARDRWRLRRSAGELRLHDR